MTSEDEFPPGYDGQSQADREDAEELRVQIEREEKAWKDWRADHPSGVYNIPYVAFMAGRKSQRSRIAALEAVTEEVRSALKIYRDKTMPGVWLAMRLADLVDAPPSTVLDQMIREAKVEAWDEGYRHAYLVGVQEGYSGKVVEYVAPNPYRKTKGEA